MSALIRPISPLAVSNADSRVLVDNGQVFVSILDLDVIGDAIGTSPISGTSMPGDPSVRRRDAHYRILCNLLYDIDPACSRETIQRTRHGRPYLRGGPHFSLSRSGRWGAIAISRKCSVGIDIEMARTVYLTSDAIELVRKQLAALAGPGLPASEPLEDWTRLEAALKCQGSSLSVMLSDGLKAEGAPSGSAAGTAVTDIHITSIVEPFSYVAALAVSGGEMRIRRRDFKERSKINAHLLRVRTFNQ